MQTNTKDQDIVWSTIIQAKSRWWNIDFREICQYKDLLFLFVRRDFVSVYKQTILGPLWFFIQPVLTSLMFTVIFGRVAKIPTDDVPPMLFYLTGITAWNYFATCITKTATVFTSNAAIFGKVYFPRLIVPLSIVISNLIRFGIQFLLLLCFIGYYWWNGNMVQSSMLIVLTPILVMLMAGIGLGVGIIVSSLTSKYRDLQYLVSFGVQLLMYATPIIYPLSILEGKYRLIALINPLAPVIEAFRVAYLGKGIFDPVHLLYSFLVMLVLLFMGVLLFNKVEKSFIDTV